MDRKKGFRRKRLNRANTMFQKKTGDDDPMNYDPDATEDDVDKFLRLNNLKPDQ